MIEADLRIVLNLITPPAAFYVPALFDEPPGFVLPVELPPAVLAGLVAIDDDEAAG